MEATSGNANIFGRPAREMRSQTGYLTQTFSLYPDLTVAENIRYSGDLRRIRSAGDRSSAAINTCACSTCTASPTALPDN